MLLSVAKRRPSALLPVHTGMAAFVLCLASATRAYLPPPLTVVNAIDGDDLFNVTMGTPGSCSCEQPSCNLSPATGTRLMTGDAATYAPNGCEYYSIGGGISSATGNPCGIFRADNAGCTFNPGSPTGECARVANTSCTAEGTTLTLRAIIDRTCDVLPYAGCDPNTSRCCGAENVCALAPPSTTYYMCQPVSSDLEAALAIITGAENTTCDERKSQHGSCGADNTTVCGEPGKCCVPGPTPFSKCRCDICIHG